MNASSRFWDQVGRREGHFLLESGHHGDLWLDLEGLLRSPAILEAPIGELASRIATGVSPSGARASIATVCSPLVEGAFVALSVAQRLACSFSYSIPTRIETPQNLYPVAYEIPAFLEPALAGQRVAIGNDFINAGSAVQGTLRSLERIGARVELIACLGTLGGAAQRIAEAAGARLETLNCIENAVWRPSDCPIVRCIVAASRSTIPVGSVLCEPVGAAGVLELAAALETSAARTR